MKVGGYLLFLASLGVGVYAYRPQSFDLQLHDAEPPVAEAAPVGGALERTPRLFSFKPPQEPAPTTPVAVVVATSPPPAPAVAKLAAAEDAQFTRGKLTSVKPADDQSRYALVRNLQRELRRAGCFDGQTDGVWDGASKRAMGAFMERVNAALPYHEPDYVLLTLVRSHKGGVCGEACPNGQGKSEDGRCMPNAIVAKQLRRLPNATHVAEHKAAGEPARASEHEHKGPALKTPFKTTVQVAHAETAAEQAPASAGVTTRAREPLPGRMAMGAPGSTSDSGDKGWWEMFIGSPAPSEPQKEQTLDAPVGLTRVPAPRPAQRPASAVKQPAIKQVRTASLEPTSTTFRRRKTAQAPGQPGSNCAASRRCPVSRRDGPHPRGARCANTYRAGLLHARAMPAAGAARCSRCSSTRWAAGRFRSRLLVSARGSRRGTAWSRLRG